MKFLLLFLFVWFSSLVHARTVPCKRETLPVKDLLEKIIQTNKSEPGLQHSKDLILMYLISSVHTSYTYCKPRSPSSSSGSGSWGRFNTSSKNDADYAFWDGDVKDKQPLYLALELLKSESEKEEASEKLQNKFKMAWIYEKLGDFDKALVLYKEVFETASVFLKKNEYCKGYPCMELRLTVDTLMFQLRIYESQKLPDKAKELIEPLKFYIDKLKSSKVLM